jgi:hypothetical protein
MDSFTFTFFPLDGKLDMLQSLFGRSGEEKHLISGGNLTRAGQPLAAFTELVLLLKVH